MPTYEYRCLDCRRRSSVFLLSFREQVEPRCPHCGSLRLERIMSRFATVRSEEARLDALAGDPGLGDIDEKDPASMARWMRKMGREFGEDLGDEFEGALEEPAAAESGSEESEGEDSAAGEPPD